MRFRFNSTAFYVSIFLLIVAIPFVRELVLKNNPVDSQEPVIEFWQYWSGAEKEPLEKLVAKFNSEHHGFKVKMLTVSMARKKILMAISGGVPPDLMHLDGDMVSDFGLRGALVDLNVIEQSIPEGHGKEPKAAKQSHFIPIFINMLNINRHQYAMPLMPTCEAMHVNKSLLQKYGLGVPATLDDVVKVFDVMSRSSTLNTNQSETIGWLPSWPPWSGKFIVSMFGGNWDIANSPENIAAWTWVQENFARKIPKDKLAAYTEGFHSYQSPDNPFYAGRIAIENSGVWEYNLAGIFAPKMQVAVAPFPSSVIARSAKRDEAISHPTQVAVDALAIPRGAKHAEQAAEFMQWLLTQENLEYLALAQRKFTPLKTHSEEFFSKHENPYIKVFIDLANSPNASYFPQVSYANRYKREIKEAYLRVLRLEQSPKEALDELQGKFEEN